MPALDKLTIEVVADTSKATKNIAKLAGTLKTLSEGSSGTAGAAESIRKAADAVAKFCEAANSTNGVATKIKKVGAALNELQNSVSGLQDTAKGIDAVAGALNRLADASDKVADAINRIADAGQSLSGVASNIRDVSRAVSGASAVGATNPTPNIVPSTSPETETGVAEVAEKAAEAAVHLNLASRIVAEFTHTLEGLGTVGVTSVKMLAKGFKGLYSVASAVVKIPLSKMGEAVTNLGKKVKNLVSSFGRIAMYRALRTAIKAITTGFSEGIKHLYQWSELTGNSFKSSMDSLATSAHYLRDSLGAMASPLIDAVAPAIEALTEKFVALLNVVNQFMAALTGKDTWRKAVRTPTTYSGAMKEAADNTRKATKAQKELNKALQGFDELNLITTSEIKARKPSSSTGKEPEVTSEEFETKPIADWIQAIKKAIEKGDWAGAGTLLAEKLNGLVEDWKAKEFGNKLGEKFQKGLDFYLAFMEKFEWENLGTKVGQMFNGIFETMNAEDLGHALVAHIKAAVKFAKGFLKEAEPTFQALGVAVSTAINDLFDKDFANELGETLGTAVKDAITFLKTMIVGSEKILQNYDTGETITVKVGGIDFKQVGESLMTAIFTAIKTIDWADLGETMAGLFTGIIDAIGAGISYAAEHISEIAGAIKDFAVAFFSRMWEWFWPTVFQFLTGGEGYTYQGGDGNDRPNAPTSTGAGASTLPEFNTEMKGMTDGLTEAWKYLEEHNPLNLEVTDTKGTVKAQEKSVEGLNLDLDHTNGTFTSKFATKNLSDREKAVKPYWTKVTSLDDTLTSNFKTKNLDDRKKAVTPYWDKVTGLAKTITTKFATSNLSETKKQVSGLQQALDDLSKQQNIKVKMTVDVANAGTSQQHLEVNNYFGTGLTAHAEGGFPQGSLFVAGEVPGEAEMVGNINGKTGVASGKEITGIADAVRDTGQTEAELLREQNNLLRRLLTKTGTVTLAPSAAAGRWVNQSQAAYARATGG